MVCFQILVHVIELALITLEIMEFIDSFKPIMKLIMPTNLFLVLDCCSNAKLFEIFGQNYTNES